MQKVTIPPFMVIGISVRTSNVDGKAAQDIPQLWNQFMADGIAEKIPNKLDGRIFSLYTNYDGDHNMPYDTILACSVSSLDEVPEGMVGHTIAGGEYEKFVVQGNLAEGLVYQAWMDIWEKNLNRLYTTDFEVYDERSQNPSDAVVDILIGVKS